MSRLTKLDNDITKVKGTYMPYDERHIITLSNATYIQCLLNKLGKLEDLEEELGCPLEVRLKVVNGTLIFDEYGNCFKVEFVSNNIFIGYRTKSGGTGFKYKEYKKTWWLREDKSE